MPITSALAQELHVEPKLPDITVPPSFQTLSPYLGPDVQSLGVTRNLVLEAKLTADTPDIASGLVWRIFSPEKADDDKLPLIATAKGGTANFNLPEGSYLVHVAYGRAGATKRITITNQDRNERMVLDAGGLKLTAVLPDNGKIIENLLRFSIYGDDDTSSDRSLIAPDVKPNTVIRLNAGTYHVVSNYGSANAIIRADIRVEAGKLTEATVQHRAADIALKLVREAGGEALADTSWSVLNASGDIVRESVGAYASMVLAEGEYVAVAKNKDRIYQRDFKVSSGDNEDVEVVANSENEASNEESMD